MTLTQDAGIVDLRLAWLPLRETAWSSAGEEVEGDEDEAGSSSGAATSPADAGADDDDEPKVGDVRDPERQRLSREAARYRNTAKAEKDRADAAEGRATSLEDVARELLMQNAFLRCAGNRLADVDAAWKLADRAGITVADDGTVEGVDEVLARVIERYPYIAAEPTGQPDPLAERFPALQPSGRPTNAKRKQEGQTLNLTALAAKYPALARKR